MKLSNIHMPFLDREFPDDMVLYIKEHLNGEHLMYAWDGINHPIKSDAWVLMTDALSIKLTPFDGKWCLALRRYSRDEWDLNFQTGKKDWCPVVQRKYLPVTREQLLSWGYEHPTPKEVRAFP